MFGLFKKGNSTEKFWRWFGENEKRLRNFEENPDKYLTEVFAQARKIQPGLAIEFEPPKNGIINMTVSANGDRNLFNIVQNIIDKSPTIDGWKFIAFRQRMNIDHVKEMKLKVKNHELNPKKMKCRVILSGWLMQTVTQDVWL